MIRLVFFSISLMVTMPAFSAKEFSLENTVFEKVGKEQGVDSLLLYSIAINVSGRYVGKGENAPSIYAMRSKKGTYFHETKSQAEDSLASLLKETDWVDVGIMQINVHYHPQSDPLLLFDPYYNITVAAKFLNRTMSTTTDPILGVGRYFGWNSKDTAIKNGQRVWATYSHLKKLIFEQGNV